MANRLSPSLLRSFSRPHLTGAGTLQLRASLALYSTETAPPPLLSKLKDDLKGAMKAKDTNRLAALRSVLAATVNASKTDAPITTDSQLVILLTKMAKKSREAAAQAREAGRPELAEKEEAEQRILEEYVAAPREVIKEIIEAHKARLIDEGVDRTKLRSRLIKELLLSEDPALKRKGMVSKYILETTKFFGGVTGDYTASFEFTAKQLKAATTRLETLPRTMAQAKKRIQSSLNIIKKHPAQEAIKEQAVPPLQKARTSIVNLRRAIRNTTESVSIAIRALEDATHAIKAGVEESSKVEEVHKEVTEEEMTKEEMTKEEMTKEEVTKEEVAQEDEVPKEVVKAEAADDATKTQ
ncbi:hypothetical protein MFIFM68171_09045 [Madurella fahalii]|uniref:Altered inheritance of mitochondria protein 41 n=1 Tax=Madurella fahalii TaxID=1157608 RepID=A0ABQ0GM81_9PEZI